MSQLSGGTQRTWVLNYISSYITRPPLCHFYDIIFIKIAGLVFCLCCASPSLSASILTTVETKPLKRSGSHESSTECSHFVWLNLLWQASMLCFGKTCCSGKLRNFTISEKKKRPTRCSKDLRFEKRSSASLRLKSPLRSKYSRCNVFAYLWEMGVTVIKLTGSQFCRVWIMKSYKMWKSKDIFLKHISFNLVAELVKFGSEFGFSKTDWYLMIQRWFSVGRLKKKCQISKTYRLTKNWHEDKSRAWAVRKDISTTHHAVCNKRATNMDFITKCWRPM